jgi:hypothetical protein
MMVYIFLGVIVGGQLLARVSNHLTPDVGIVIIALISLVVSSFCHSFVYPALQIYVQVSFCGYKILHW